MDGGSYNSKKYIEKEFFIMKKVFVNVMTGLLTVAMMASMAVPTFAAELTSAEIAGADTVNGTYNVYEGTDADSDGEIDAGKASSVVVK